MTMDTQVERLRSEYGEGSLRLIPIGGLGEIGKNMMLVEYETDSSLDSIVIDTGIMFPENDMLGIDYIIPDYGYIMDRLESVRGVVVTHGHEDHTGAIAHVMSDIKAPIYATQLTCGFLEVKLRNAHLLNENTLITVHPGDAVQMGPFIVEFFHACHSIPDNVGLGITTPVGLIVHSGDYKFDHTPISGQPPDFAKLAEFSSRGVLALLADSTNADVPGWTKSESIIDAAFDRVFEEAPGRIIVATFASLISRVQQVANATQRYNRKLAIAGYSMVENVKMARRLGYLDIPDQIMVDLGQAVRMPPKDVTIMATGTQGEPSAVLGRIAYGRHKHITIEPGDTVVMSAQRIPGNEEMVHRTINKLIQGGADVLYESIAPVHVSGHAAQEEMKLLLNLIRPKFFVPVHGELRHLHMHAKIANSMGIPRENIAVVENGTILTFTADSMTIGERFPGGYVYVDGTGVGDVGPAVLRDREILGRSGFVIANITLDRDTHELIGRPEFTSRGFVYQRESEDLMLAAEETVVGALNGNGKSAINSMRRDVVRKLDKFFYTETKRRPMVFAFIKEI